MIRLTPQQRVTLSETFRDLANVIAGALVVGQFLGQSPSPRTMLAGMAGWLILVAVSLALVGGSDA
jgi:hypothetical protein